ncbi:DEAD/DEAH box helicase family protein [Dethiobacter alkaliphilus]|uniref:DEAD/DEAH box helicase family protein n=1 Tax=Dethiobacter alkaliphilus TaxID=427926 RepID=UPI002225CE1B|nr:DEAD/DEAH box helicase family protein [Dethiobacter alkaliphilus]MCW3490227.1 DEAD/DEAH box helicase family protein [Dethiobacter alkaliphilus]
MTNVITGRENFLVNYLSESIQKAQSIRFIVSFLMESGAKLLVTELENAAKRGVPIKILTGRYLEITEPAALYYLMDRLRDGVEIRFVRENLHSFHPKAYLFDHEEDSEIYVGSSNISKTALTNGVEWNYRLLRSQSPDDYDTFSEMFDTLFYEYGEPVTDKILRQYAMNWKRSAFARSEILDTLDQPEPVGAQVEALYELRKAREEGIGKGLVVAATGVGKTFLSAFDSAGFEKVLFVAHREEILRQAEKTYSVVRDGGEYGYYYGGRKDDGVDVLFATVHTLGNHLDRFRVDEFDYVVVDEFHHAAADSYLKVLDYFQPRFLLGLTATPYRMDNRDIFALCDDNVIYEIYLKDAINRDLLVPFRYYGVYDATDYDRISIRNGQYVVEELESELSTEERAGLVLEKYQKMAGKRTLAFCTSVAHADYMAGYFNRHGVEAASVHSRQSSSPYVMERKAAIGKLENGELRAIFCVDIFNEGVDVPALDTVMFLRPTESFVVFLQQLGRGLRKHEGKESLTVLDFIGNYKRAHYLPALLAGDNPVYPQNRGKRIKDLQYPDNCHVQFDFRVLDLFEEMAARDPLKKRMVDEYFRLKEELKRRPDRFDMFEGTDIPFRKYIKIGWLRFLAEVDQLTDEEKAWLDTPAEGFLRDMEKTAMAKSYKIPAVSSFLTAEGSIAQAVPLHEVGERFKEFLLESPVHQKDMRDKSNRDWQSWQPEKFAELMRKNPIYFLSKPGKFYHYDEINKVFYLNESIKEYLGPNLARHVKDILIWRKAKYFRKRFREVE